MRDREQELFRSQLQIIDAIHALVKLERLIEWRFLEEKLGRYQNHAGRASLPPTRLMAGLEILTQT